MPSTEYLSAAIASSHPNAGVSVSSPLSPSRIQHHCDISPTVFTHRESMYILRLRRKSICAFTLPGSFFTPTALPRAPPRLYPVGLRTVAVHDRIF